MGSRGSSSGKLKAPSGPKGYGSSDLIETVPSLVPKEITRLKEPSAFGAAYAREYRNARNATPGQIAAGAVSTWIAKNGYNSSEKTTDAENAVYKSAMDALRS